MTHFPEKGYSLSIALFLFRAQGVPMNRTAFRQLIDASLGISHQHTNPGTAVAHDTDATQKPSALAPESPVVATESESDPEFR